MKKTLRPYQSESIDLLSKGWKGNKRQVLALPTGAGKTFTFVDIAKRADDRGKTVIILTHREELFNQTHDSFTAFGIHPYKINADTKFLISTTGIFVVMVETLARRRQILDSIDPDLIIIDEAHQGNFSKIIDVYPDSFVLAVTATPIGKHFIKYYTNIVQTIDTPDLIKQGYLVPYKAYQMQDDFGDLKKGANGDFSEKSQFTHFDKVKMYNGVVGEWKKRCNGKKTIVFNCNIKHAHETTQHFIEAGVSSGCITSKTPKKERKAIIDQFENGDLMVLNNATILTAGYDYPPIECVILNRATDSLVLYLQMIGRGSRTSPGKTHFTCLDFGGNHTRHGMWSYPREWKLESERRKKKGEAVVKECPNCDAMTYASVTRCPYCDYEFPIKVKDPKSGVMVEYLEKDIPDKPMIECTPEEISILVKVKRIKPNQGIGIIRRRGKDALHEYARLMGYNGSWVKRQLSILNSRRR